MKPEARGRITAIQLKATPDLKRLETNNAINTIVTANKLIFKMKYPSLGKTASVKRMTPTKEIKPTRRMEIPQ